MLVHPVQTPPRSDVGIIALGFYRVNRGFPDFFVMFLRAAKAQCFNENCRFQSIDSVFPACYNKPNFILDALRKKSTSHSGRNRERAIAESRAAARRRKEPFRARLEGQGGARREGAAAAR